MNKGLAFGAGLGMGTVAMYVLDPDRGKRRRALLRDKLAAATKKTGKGIEITARDFRNRAQGIAASIQSRFSSAETDDAVLVDRVRSKLGRIVSHPRAIEVASENNNVTLSGPILEAEVDNLLTCVRQIRGINSVANNLEVHEEGHDHPLLQGGQERLGNQSEFLQEHWSPSARFVASAAGASLAVYGGVRRDALGTTLGAAGLLLLTRGITNTSFSRLTRSDHGLRIDGKRKRADRGDEIAQNMLNHPSVAM